MHMKTSELPWECDLTYRTGTRKNVRDYEPFPQWQIKLMKIPSNAPYFYRANLLLGADCSAFAYANFHRQISYEKVTLICCPNEGEQEMIYKINEIVAINEIAIITLVRMVAPCCCGFADMVMGAVKASK